MIRRLLRFFGFGRYRRGTEFSLGPRVGLYRIVGYRLFSDQYVAARVVTPGALSTVESFPHGLVQFSFLIGGRQ